MVVSNVSELITGRINTDRLAVTDSNGNSYIGCNAGPALANLTTYSNTAIGVNAMAGASNSSNNVSLGLSNFSGLTNGMCNVGIGAKTIITGAGQENILIGTNITMGDGSGNIIIGNDLSLGNISKTFRLGSLLYGDLSSGFVGINTSKPEAALDISGIVVFRNKVGFQNPEPTYSLDVAGSVFASEQIIGSNGTFTNPLFTFKDASGTGMYVPASGAGFGDGAFGIAVNRSPAAIFSSNAVNFYQNLDVSGTFSARGVVLDGFAVQNGTAAVPTMTFENDSSTGLFLVGTDRLGLSTDGLRRMEILPTGDVSMARLVTRDISYSGTIVGTDPTTCNVIGGVTLQNGNVILTGTATNSNLLVPGWIRNTDPATQLDISGGNISNSLTTRSSNFRASAGTAGVPVYSFASDPSTGLHSAGASQLAFDTAGLQRMVISNGNVGIGKANPVVALEVVGDVSATTYNGPGGTQSAPHYTFSDDRTTGLFFPGANMIGLTAGGTERMRISNSNVGIGTTAPTNALDVSGTLRVIGTAGDLTLSNGSIKLGSATLLSSSGVLSNAATTSNSIGGVTLDNNQISNSSTTTSSNFRGANGSVSAPMLAFTSSTNTGLYTTATGNLDVATGGFRCMNLAPGGVTTYLGLRAAGSSPQISINATTGLNNTISFNSTAAGALAIGNQVAGLPDGQFGVSTDGGVTAPFRVATSGVVVPGHIRDALIPSTLDISGGNISNSGVTRSSNFLAAPGGAPRPAYAFTTDPSSGLDLVGTSYLAFDTSGVQRMCISGDLVGIGTAAPAFTLDICSAGPTYGLQIRNPAAAGNIGLRLSNGTGGEGHFGLAGGTDSWTPGTLAGDTVIRATCNFLINTKATTRMVFKDANIGIGTNAPGQALDVSATFRVGNSKALFDVIPQGASADYAVTTTNGYFVQYRGGSTNKAASNIVTYLSTDVGASSYFLSNNIGIGTTAPGATLDVSGNAQVALGGAGYAQLTVGSTTSGVYIQGNRSNATSYIRSPGAGLYIGGGSGSDSTMLILNQRVAINQSDTTYALGVTAGATTAAALNLSTWPRYAVSTTHMVKARTGTASTATLSVVWPAPAISLNANLGTVTNDAVNGTYFVCKRSGLWSITSSIHGNGQYPTYIMDVSNNITYNDAVTIDSKRSLAGTLGGYYYATLSFTGYLPSNDNLYYKFRTGGLGPDTNSTYLYITFHHELPAATGFPYV